MPTGFAADVAGSAKPGLCSPPSWFRPAEGVRFAWPDAGGPFGRTPRIAGSAAQKAGKRYEKKALAFLAKELGKGFTAQQWFRFQPLAGKVRWCQPDAYHVTEDGHVTVIEIKTRFTSDAWWQLRHLYEPVVRAALKPKSITGIVVCKSYDPRTQSPEQVCFLDNVAFEMRVFAGTLGVLLWTPTG